MSPEQSTATEPTFKCPGNLSCRDPRSLRGCLTYFAKLKSGVTLDLTHVQFVDVAAMVLLHRLAREVGGGVGVFLPKKKGTREFISAQISRESSQLYSLKMPNRLPVRYVTSETGMVDEVVKWRKMLSRSTPLDDETLRGFSRTMTEVLQNSFSHGRTAGPCVLGGQTFPKQGHSILAAVDAGISIPTSLRDSGRYAKHMADHDWIRFALEKGVTAGTRESNRGFGLFLLHQKVRSNGGKLLILSGRGLVWVTPDRSEPRAEPIGKKYGSFPGTLILIDLKTRSAT